MLNVHSKNNLAPFIAWGRGFLVEIGSQLGLPRNPITIKKIIKNLFIWLTAFSFSYVLAAAR